MIVGVYFESRQLRRGFLRGLCNGGLLFLDPPFFLDSTPFFNIKGATLARG